MRIVVLGYIIRGPLGGLCWHYLQYVLGLRQLGHQVLFLEDSDNYPGCYDPEIFETTTDPAYGINFITALFKNHQLENSWAYYDEHTNCWFGMDKNKVMDFCRTAEMVINISNVNPLRDWWAKIPARILIDTDPAFTQIRHIENERYRNIAKNHTHYFSFGENFGKEGCSIPDDGFNWKPTRQPVFLDAWKITEPQVGANWTTVMQWDSYKTRPYNGIIYGMKSASFDAYFDLPKKVEEGFELAVGGDTTPLEKLENAGWKIVNPLSATLTAESFQQYLQQSKGEFSVAKHGYVISNSGWFSERSAGYLASGRPVVLQDTGFSQVIETGKGLFAFQSPAVALEAIEIINSEYAKHCNYARDLAEAYFHSDKVIGSMLSRLI